MRMVRAPASAVFFCESWKRGNANTATPLATIARIATTISTSNSVPPRARRRRTRRATSAFRDLKVPCIDISLLLAPRPSLNPIETAGHTIRPCALEHVTLALLLGRADQPKLLTPGVRRRLLEARVQLGQRRERGRTAPLVVRHVGVDRGAHAQRRRH